jgi:hypothetical protein
MKELKSGQGPTKGCRVIHDDNDDDDNNNNNNSNKSKYILVTGRGGL